METNKYYVLPKLGYKYGELAPYISEEQLRIHYEKHHQAYVTAANQILEKLEKARIDGAELDMKSTLKSLSWNIGGNLLHSIFWKNIGPANGDIPGGKLADALDNEFGSFDRFRKEFTQTASSVEGSGWAALSYCKLTKRPIIMQIEKHNTNVYPMFNILMVLDVFEHAYYIDYKNDRAKFIENFWNIINWKEVNRKFDELVR